MLTKPINETQGDSDQETRKGVTPGARRDGQEAPTADWLAARRVNIAGAWLDDLVGLEAAKREISGLAARLAQRQRIVEAGASLSRGALFHGPPGCGKTSLARGLAALIGPETHFFELSSAEMTAERVRSIGDFLTERHLAVLRGSPETQEPRAELFSIRPHLCPDRPHLVEGNDPSKFVALCWAPNRVRYQLRLNGIRDPGGRRRLPGATPP